MVIRPKSMATVVVRLPATPVIRSMSAPGADRSSSVRSGRISVSAPTSVVLPTPKPPATRILTATGAGASWSARRGTSQSPQAIGHLSEQPDVGEPLRAGPADSDQPAVAEIREQDADHAERQVK